MATAFPPWGDGPLSGTADTIRYRYNAAREIVGTISADPDGGGSLKHRAVRNTYDSQGLLTKVEGGTVNSQSDADWSGMSVIRTSNIGYDTNGRQTTETVEAGSTIYALVQTSYDAVGRVECVAQRMNSATYSSLPSSACSLATAGTYGSDRITKTAYDGAGQVTSVKTGYGTSVESTDVTPTYSSNGLAATVTDAESNKTTYEHDGHDRLVKTRFPSTTKGAGTSSTTDYEQYAYDANGNRTSFRNRANETIAFTFDALNRTTAKDLPGSEPDVSYGYDLLGRMTSAAQTGNSLSFTFDALGRNLTQVGPHGTIASTWDLAGRRTRITHPDSNYWDYDYLVTGELSKVRENGATSGVGVLATYNYDTSSNAGQRGIATGISFGNGASTSYAYDAVQRLTTLGHDISGTTYDQSLGFSYNPANQITQNTRSNDLYAWNGHYNVNRNYTANGLNQYTASGSVTPTYDSKGNLTSAGSTTYTYSSENLLKTASGGITLGYDPAMRLYETAGGSPGTTRRQYDGVDLVGEYNGSGTLVRRYVHGAGTDVPIAWYEGSGLITRRFMQTDERGSVTAITDSSGSMVATNAYDEYGIPASTNVGRFQYTGQTWLPELGLYYYKARFYSPTLGRFLQPDPIGWDGGPNLYNYAESDPVNLIDPGGLKPYQLYPTAQAALNAIRADYFPLSVKTKREYGGQIYQVLTSRGYRYFYNDPQIGDINSIDRFFLAYTSSAYLGSRAIWEWHTHITGIWNKPSEDDRIRANETQLPGIILYPGGGTIPYHPQKKGPKSSKPGGVSTPTYLYIYQDWVIDGWRVRFGPGGAAALVAYMLHCIVGEVDLCTEPTTGIPSSPREVPSE